MSILDLESIASWQVDGTVKGFPGMHRPLALRDIGRQGWNLFDGRLPMPVAVLKRSAIESNRRWMREFLERSGVRIAPQGKATMSPQLFELQLQDGAWGMTCATVEQLHVYRRFGVERVLMANQLVGRGNIEYVVSEINRDEKFVFHCIVDSVDGVRHLVQEAGRLKLRHPISVLVEFGVTGGRTGARTPEAVFAVAREIAQHPEVLRLSGFETYERMVPAGPPEQTGPRIRALLKDAGEIARKLDTAGLFEGLDVILVSAGGTDYVDLAASWVGEVGLSRPTMPLIRSGCYLTLDHGAYAQAYELMRSRELVGRLQGRLMPALEIWGYVQSRQDGNRAFVTLGKRDVSHDLHMPVPIAWARPGEPGVRAIGAEVRVTGLNDQHAYLQITGDSPLRVGDMVAFGVSHPCTTFDKWRLIYIVDDEYRVVDAIRTFF
jgi:D-serine dehydratase